MPSGPIQIHESDKDFEDFTASHVLLLPGQGAQKLKMGCDCVEKSATAKQLFQEASTILGYNLLDVCTTGPKSKLDRTEICQPAIFVHSMAAYEVLKQDKEPIFQPTVACGLSLGEYTALCCAGAISFADGVRITKERGEAMQEAAELHPGSMVSLLNTDLNTVNDLVAEVQRTLSAKELVVSNYLCPSQYVVSGSSKACNLVQELAPSYKIPMAIPLAVAGAFHTEYMSPAQERLAKVLDSIEIKKPSFPVISNVDAKPHSDPEVIRELLKRQLVSPVLWSQTMDSLVKAGFNEGYEVGPGRVLKGISMKVPNFKGSVTCIG